MDSKEPYLEWEYTVFNWGSNVQELQTNNEWNRLCTQHTYSINQAKYRVNVRPPPNIYIQKPRTCLSRQGVYNGIAYARLLWYTITASDRLPRLLKIKITRTLKNIFTMLYFYTNIATFELHVNRNTWENNLEDM